MQILAIFLGVFFLVGCGDPMSELSPRKQDPDASNAAAPPPTGDASLIEGDGGPIVEVTPGAEVAFDPPATPAGVAPIVRVRFKLPEPASPDGAILVSGTLSKSQLRDISKGKITMTVGDRRVNALIWSDPDEPQAVLAAPLTSLIPGELYTLALANPSSSTSFVVSESELPVLLRVWPWAKDAAASPNFAIWCGDAPLAFSSREARVDPFGVVGTMRLGIGAQTVDAASCLRWDATEPVTGDVLLVPPPAVELDDGRLVALDPAPLLGNGMAPELEPAPCPASEIAFGPACIHVDDDRLTVRPSYWSALWAVESGNTQALQVALEGARFLVRPLPPASSVMINAAAVDAAGRVIEIREEVTTAPPRAHLVVNEVMAAPKGPEPAQEWIELVNDGSEPADLADYQLAVADTAVPLPSVILPPGAYAVVVSEAYVLGEGSDVPPASGTRLVRIPKLGKRGLSNEGQVIALLDKEGAVVSRFPALPKPQKGVSVIRVRPDALDELPGSFAYDPNGGSSPGVGN